MSRRGSRAALALSLALVIGAALALIGGVALGGWQPAGPSRQATPPPGNVPGFGSGVVAYDEFLAEVRAGRVYDVYRDGDILQVNGAEQPYTVEVPPGDPDVFGDILAAADAGGVPMPGFSRNGGPGDTPEQISYAALLEMVEAGRVHEVFHTGDLLEVNTVDGLKRVAVPAGVDVLDDIEASAKAAGRAAPYYSKAPVPEQPE
jgi:hypothetical protein